MQFIVSVVELIMLSWQQILLHNFQNTRVSWLFYHFFKLQVHILHGLEGGELSWQFLVEKAHKLSCPDQLQQMSLNPFSSGP